MISNYKIKTTKIYILRIHTTLYQKNNKCGKKQYRKKITMNTFNKLKVHTRI